jgi:hypothetical protein
MTVPGVYAREPDGGWTPLYADAGGETYHLHDIKEAGGVGTRGQDPDGTPLLALSRTDVEMVLLDPPAGLDEMLLALVGAVREHLRATGQKQVTLRQVFPAA